MRIRQEFLQKAREKMNMGLNLQYADMGFGPKKGSVIFDMRDARTGDALAFFEKDNLIVRDAGILAASLYSGNAVNPNGLIMLAVGTGATGPILSPDAPTDIQRSLNSEIERKAFSSKQYRNSSGVAVAIRTNIVDYTVTFGEAEAVGPLNEMALVSTASPNPAITNPIPTVFPYDETVDVTGMDLLANYLTFGVITKPATATLTITWRLTF
jgi:hypothetical protein